MTGLLVFLFFASGASALLFQTLWFRQAGLMLGNSVWATALVTASFMGGLALGSAIAGRRGAAWRHPVRVYGALEAAIGLTGLGLVLALPRLTAAFAPFLGSLGGETTLLNLARLGIAFALLLIPATAMGATLPALVLALSSTQTGFSRVIGTLYGWNTLGAVAGALAGELVLVESLGMTGTAFVAASLNGIAVVASLWLSKRVPGTIEIPTTRDAPAFLAGRVRRLQVAAFVAGGLLLSLEVVWFRLIQLFVMATSLSFAMMLAVVLSGIGVGGLLTSRLVLKDADAVRWLPATALGAGCLTAWTYSALRDVLDRLGPAQLMNPVELLQVAAVLMFPTSLLSGALFTMTGTALRSAGMHPTRAAGSLASANTIGAMLGSILTSLFLLPRLGMENSVALLSALYLLVALASLDLPAVRAHRMAAMTAVIALGAHLSLLAFFPFGLMKRHYAARPVAPYLQQGSRVVAYREAVTETISYLRREGFAGPTFNLVTNAYSMSGTGFHASRYMSLYVHWPVAVHPRPRHALLISYGVGLTARALTRTKEFETIDVVDISKDILEMGRIVFEEPGTFPLDDPRVRVHVEDGRFFLLAGERKFDVITAEPPPPKAAGIVNLYSKEYFELIRRRLAAGGVTTYWLPVYQMSSEEAKAIVRGFCDVFEDCSLWAGIGLEWMLVGTNGALGPVSEERFAAQWSDPVVGPALRAIGLDTPESLGATFLGDAPILKEMTSRVLPLEDDHPLRISPRTPPTIDPFYAAFMASTPLSSAFRSSELTRRLWPPGLRERTAAAIGSQRGIEVFRARRLIGIGTLLEDLDAVLASDASTTAVLSLFLLSDAEAKAARDAASRGLRDPSISQALGLFALAERDYAGASGHLAGVAEAGGVQVQHQLWLLALGLSGKRAEAVAAATTALATARDPATRAEFEWLVRRFSPGYPRDR